MGRPPVVPPEKMIRIVLAVLAGGVSVSDAARREKASEQSVHLWKADFVEAGKVGLTADRSGPIDVGTTAGGRGRGADTGAG